MRHDNEKSSPTADSKSDGDIQGNETGGLNVDRTGSS
jgi:hypothetical protein